MNKQRRKNKLSKSPPHAIEESNASSSSSSSSSSPPHLVQQHTNQDTFNWNERFEKGEIFPNLFTLEGRQMVFYIAPCEAKPQISNLIIAGGGIVQKSWAPNVYTLVEPKTDISSKIQGNCYSIEFVHDAVIEDKLPDIEKYILKPKKRKSTKRDSFSSPRKRHKFTLENDQKLAQFVKKHSEYTPSSSRLWRLAEQEEIAEGHTWQSMRSRYLKVVSPKVDGQFNGQLADESLNISGLDSHHHHHHHHHHHENHSNNILDNDSLKDKKIEDEDDYKYFDALNVPFVVPNDIDDVLSQEIKKQNRNSNNNIILLQMEHSKESVDAIINTLISITKLPRSVVVHGLIVNSGVVSDTIQYLQNPEEFYRSRTKSTQIWSYAEDKSLLEKNKHAIEELTRERGIEAIQKRQIFLES